MTSASVFSYRDKVLELDSRKKIYFLVKKHAGCHFRDIERKSGLAGSSLKYHLNYLVKHDLINESRDGNVLRYFPKEFDVVNKVLMGLLRQESIRKILIFILNNKNCNQEEIVRAVKLSGSTVSWYLKKLVRVGVVKKVKIERGLRYSLGVDDRVILGLLFNYRESFLDSLVNNVVDMWGVG